MATEAATIAFLTEQLSVLGPVKARRMFGGAGVYCDGVMFALIADDTLYLKADDASRGDFEAEGMPPFTYATKDGQRSIMSYWKAPERLLDEPDEMLIFARKALAAARRAHSAKGAGGPRSRKPARGGRPTRASKGGKMA